MAKALKAVGTAIVIVGAIAATGGAALAFGAGAGVLGAASLATSAVLSVGGFSVSAGALLSVGGLVSSIGGSLSQPKVSTAGNALGWVGNPNGPMHFAAGRIAVGGDLRHKKAYGPNDRMYFSAVTVVSDAGPIAAFEGFTANDVPVTFGADGKANSSFYSGKLWRRTQLGFQPEASYLASPSGLEGGAVMPNWGPQHKLSGKAATILTMVENSKGSAYKGQQPRPREIIRGLLVYDWRQDSTFPGGSGPQRLHVPATWTYSANPALWSAKWEFGLWEGPEHGGAPQLDTQVGGIGVQPNNLDFAAYTEWANICDTHGWTVSAWPSTDDDKMQVLDAFMQAGGAYYIQRAGKESCIHRAAPRVSVATISAADTAGPIELDTGASFTQRKNCGVPTYLSEADGWKMTALGQVSSDQWITEDGGRERSAPVTYAYVDKAKQAAELMCLAIAHTREGIRGRIPLKPYMQGIQPGSAFTISEPEFVLNGLKCLCLETNYDALTGVHTVTFVSESDGKYAFAFGQAPNPPAPPALEAVDPTFVTAPLPLDFTVIPVAPGAGGSQQPGFDLSGVVSNETATAVLVEYWPVPTGVDPNIPPPSGAEWKSAGTWPPTAQNIPVIVPAGGWYWIALTYFRDTNSSARTILPTPYEAPALDPGPNAPSILAVREDIDALADLQASETVIRQDQVNRLFASSGGGLNANPAFAAFTDPTMPDVWIAWGRQDNARVTGRFSAWALRQHDNTGGVVENTGIVQTSAQHPGLMNAAAGYYVLEADIRLVSGGLRGAGLLLYAGVAAGDGDVLTLNFGTEPDINGLVASGPSPMSRSFRKLVRLNNPANGVLTLHVMTHWDGFAGPRDVKYLIWDRVVVRAASSEEIAAGTALPALQTQTEIIQSNVLDLESQNELARLQLYAAASGGLPSLVEIVSSTEGDYIALISPLVALLNNAPGGGAPLVAMEARGGEVFFPRPVYVDVGTRRLIVGPGNGWVLWFGGQDRTAATATRTNGVFSLGDDGKVYYGGSELGVSMKGVMSPPEVERQGIGSLTTDPVTMVVTGATGALKYVWQYLSGDGSITPNSSGLATTTFTGTVSSGQTKTALWACTAFDAATGQSTSAVETVRLVGTL